MSRLFFLLLICCSCSKKNNIIPTSKMKDVMWDYVRADVYTTQFLKKDSTLNYEREHAVILKKIFDKYKISEKDFFESYQYYTSKPELFNPLLDSIFVKQSAPPKIKKISRADE